MSYNELQDGYTVDFELGFSSKVDPVAIVNKTDILTPPKSPKLPSADRRAILEARHLLKEYIYRHNDKPYAFWEVFKAVYGKRLTRNAWTGQIYIYESVDGLAKTATNPERLVSNLEDALELSSKMSWEDFKRKLECHLGEIGFSPVYEYLEQVARKYPEPMLEWDNLAVELFGVEDPLSQEMLTKWLIGATARVMQPGCQMRQCLVLKGKQETGKTQFLRALFGDYYASRDSEMQDADVYRQLRACWGMELEEMEAIASKRSVENLKRFISVQEDEWVAKYKEESKKHPRHSVFAGTVNSDEFLRDETGNSRFWVIDFGSNPVNVEYVKLNRDRIWAEAYRRWSKGERHWDAELSKKAQQRASEYQVTNEFLEPLEVVLARLDELYEGKQAIRGTDLLTTALNILPERHRVNRADRKVANAMQALGYEKRSLGSAKVYCKTGVTSPELVNASTVAEARNKAYSYDPDREKEMERRRKERNKQISQMREAL